MSQSTKSLNLSAIIAPSIWLASLTAAPGAFAAQNSLDAYVVDNSGWSIDESITSTTGPVSYDSTTGIPWPVIGSTPYPNTGEVTGVANFGVLKAKALSSVGGSETNRDASVDVASEFSVTVNAAPPPIGGGPGLNFGDSVSLNVSLSLDGTVNSGAATGDNSVTASAGANLTIVDPNILLDCGSPDGCFTPTLMDFNAGASSQSYGSNGYTYNGWNWDIETRDAADTLIDNQFDSNSWDVGPGASCLPTPGNNFCTNDIIFDTGILTATIDTTVGATLDINAGLDIFITAWNFGGDGAYGAADFFDTFGFSLTPVTEGVVLDYGDVTVVPVPAAVWLFGSGLIGLVGFARRK